VKDTAKTTRAQRGIALFRERGGEIERAADGTYRVPSSNGAVYVVDLDRGYCSCPDRAECCKHRVACEVVASRDRCKRPARPKRDRSHRADGDSLRDVLAGLPMGERMAAINRLADRMGV